MEEVTFKLDLEEFLLKFEVIIGVDKTKSLAIKP
jgi:hypothetical protein